VVQAFRLPLRKHLQHDNKKGRRDARTTRKRGDSSMRIGDVIGTVTLNRVHPSVAGATWKLVVPLTWDNLLERSEEPAEEVVVYDELGAGIGNRIALSEGREAAMPFYPDVKPLDAYNAAILDRLEL
jgi:ethanolamine utilization protein EutN